jgi:2-hydroxy-6-oxonona-2,4-dienedioate hydrolase
MFLTFHYSLRDQVEAKLPAVSCPTLVVRGTKDPICRAGWAEFVADRLPRGRLALIPDVAHTLCYTAPGKLAEVTRRFLRQPAKEPAGAVAS